MVVGQCQITSVDTAVGFVGFHGVSLLSAAVSMCLSYYIQGEQYYARGMGRLAHFGLGWQASVSKP